MTALNWLHLTDWHIGQKDEGLWPNVKDLLLKDLHRLAQAQKRAHGEPWDVVFFTGDLAFSGKESQYKQLTRELESIWKVFREEWPEEKEPVLLCVPGNHDLDRSKVMPTLEGMRDTEGMRKWLFGGDPRALADVEGPFAEYTKWWEGCPLRPQRGLIKGLLPGEFSYVLEKEGVRFGFIGLNTAFMDFDEKSKGKLWLDVQQLHKACGGSAPEFLDDSTLAFLLTHHPPDWLSPEANAHYKGEMIAGERFVAHLCGHLHEAFSQEHRQGFGREHRLMQGVSLFGLERLPNKEISRKHGYSAGRLLIDDTGRSQLMLWPRLAVKLQSGHWRLTADYTYELEDDLSHTPIRALDRHIQRRKAVERTPEAALGEPVSSPRTWSAVVKDTALWKTVNGQTGSLEPLRQLAGAMAEVCWKAWQEADAALVDDPWSDAQYPLRVLERLERFLIHPAGSLSPAEALALVIAPFVREAVLACGVRWMVEIEPDNLTYTSAGTEPRNTLEQVHLARPDLVRRAKRLVDAERRSLALWMMHRALDRIGALWSPPPWPTGLRQLENSLGGLMRKQGAAGLTWSRLMTLARCIGSGLDLLEAEEGPARAPLEEILEGGVRMRRAALAYLLCAAGWSALDPSLADEVAVDHIGLESSFRAEELRESLREARWSRREREEVLCLRCRQPVIDFVMKDLVARADEIMAHVRHKAAVGSGEALAPLRGLPARLSAAEVQPASDESGSPLYRSRHVRFRLDHDRIRELLMGEQLYGDPTLALRELYQNALDACRYRRARQEFLRRDKGDAVQYVGLISFRQGIEGGRPFIECADNGIGMSEYDLERIFAVAGRRFVDTPEYIEERSAWNKLSPPIELYPNSQFGIGVLSYFMLADELQVMTRRFLRDGRLGPLLNTRISSASGLFRLSVQEGAELAEGGTRVRLYLGEHGDLSVQKVLGKLLRIVEFRTELHAEYKTMHVWEPNVLGDGKSHLRVADEGVWLNASENEGIVLADGLVTGTRYPLLTVDLHGKNYPRLSVDRQRILDWDTTWPARALGKGVNLAARWRGMSMELLWSMEGHYPHASFKLFKTLVGLNAELPLHYKGKKKVAIKQIGCFLWDYKLVMLDGMAMKLEVIGKSRFSMNSIERWRIGVLEGLGLMGNLNLSPLARAVELESLLAHAGDIFLLCRTKANTDEVGSFEIEKATYNFRGPGINFLDLLATPALQEHGVDTLLGRLACYRPLGVELMQDVDNRQIRHLLRNLQPDDLRLLSVSLEGTLPWIKGSVPSVLIAHIVRAAIKLKRPAREVALRFLELAPLMNLRIDLKLEVLDELPMLEEEDLSLLSIGLDGRQPWVGGAVSIQHVFQAARKLKRLPQEVLHRLSELAPFANIQLSFEFAALESVRFEAADWVLLSLCLDGEPPWLENPVLLFHVLKVAKKLKRSPRDVARRLAELAPFAHFRLDFDPESLDAVQIEDADWILLSKELSGKGPWLQDVVRIFHVLRAARKLKRSPRDVAHRFLELAPLFNLSLDFNPEILEDLHPEDVDALLILSSMLRKNQPLQEAPNIHLGHVLALSVEVKRAPFAIARWLAELAPRLNVRLRFKPGAVDFFPFKSTDRMLLVLRSGNTYRFYLKDAVLHVQHVLRMAQKLSLPPQKVASRFVELASMDDFQMDFAPDALADPIFQEEDLEDLAALGDIIVKVRGERFRVIAHARFHLWWLTDVRVERMMSALMPLLKKEIARGEPLPDALPAPSKM